MAFKPLPTVVAGAIARVPDVASLPTDMEEGTIRYVESSDTLYTYNGGAWSPAAGGVQPPDPATSTDNAVARWDGADAEGLNNSLVIIDDLGNMSGVADLEAVNGTFSADVTAQDLDLTGNITVTGTVDGRDIAADGTALDNHIADTANPHSVTKAQVGLSNVDNTSDATKDAAATALTNKTIDADANTITNIENADIKAGAAIDATKIADGTVTNAEFQYLGGVTSDIQDQIDDKIDLTEKGANDGVATLDSGGKIPVSQLPASVFTYEGTWAASTNTPALTNGTGDAGMIYIASDAGTVDFGAGNITFAAGDFAVYNGTVWQKSINSNAVASVNGQTGVVAITTDDEGIEFGTATELNLVLDGTTLSKSASGVRVAALNTDVVAVTDVSGDLTSSAITTAELDNLAGSNEIIQDALDEGVRGPAAVTSTDTALMLWDGVGGRLAKDSSITSDGTSLDVPNDVTAGISVQAPLLAASEAVEITDVGAAAVNPATAGTNNIINRDGVFWNVDENGNESMLGGGSGELNLVDNPNDANGTWGASDAGVTVATTTTSTDLPLEGLAVSAIKMTPITDPDYVYYRWTMPVGLANTKLKAEWYQRPLSGYADGDFDFAVWTNTASDYTGTEAKLNLSTDGATSYTDIPNLTGKFTTTFDSDASLYYELRYRVRNGSTALNIANVVVGPGIQPQGAVIGEWADYTPTTAGFGTPTITFAQWRRVGSNMEVRARIVTGTVTAAEALVGLPTGYTLSTSAQSGTIVGGAIVNNTLDITTLVDTGSSTTGIYFGAPGAANPFTRLAGTVFGDTKTFSINASVKISEWGGSGTVNLAQNDVEYVYNSDTANASDTTSFAYGSAGALIGSYTAQLTKRVRFPTPIQPTDKVEMEFFNPNSSGMWQSAGTVFDYKRQNAVDYGCSFAPVSATTTDVNVVFHDYANATGATFGSAGEAWSTYNTTRWRLRKIKGGNAVGFGAATQNSLGLVKAGQVPGTNTNDNAVAGYVGEYVENTATGVSLTSPNAANITSISLTAGDWDVSASCYFNLDTTTTSTITQLAISKVSATLPGTIGYPVSGEYRETFIDSASANQDRGMSTPSVRVSLAATTTIYAVAAATFTTSTATVQGAIWARRVR